MPTLDQLGAALKAADAAGNTDDANRLARAYAHMRNSQADFSGVQGGVVSKPESTHNGLGSDWQNYLAGVGKSFVDNARGAGQAVANLLKTAAQPMQVITQVTGVPNVIGDYAGKVNENLRQAQTEANQLDAPLMATKSGLAGNITGQAAQALAAGSLMRGAGVVDSMIPQTYRGAAMAGAAQGAVQPLDSTQGEGTRLMNASLGAGGGIIGQGIPAAIGTVTRGGRALIDPLTESGQGRIVANTLARFGEGGSFTQNPAMTPETVPTLAQATRNTGLGQLQNAIADSDVTIGAKFERRAAESNASRLAQLQSIGGTPEDIAAATAARDRVANMRYGQAFQDDASQRIARQSASGQLLDQGQKNALVAAGGANAARSAGQQAAKQVTAASPQLQALAQRPAIQSAMTRAVKLAQNDGVDIGNPLESLQGLHYMKLGLDDILNSATQQGIGKAEQSAIGGAKRELVSEIERQNPAYKKARETFRDASGPIDAMKMGRAIADKATGNGLTDVAGNGVITPGRMAGAMNGLDRLAKSVTGQKNVSGEKILGPENMSKLSGILSDLNDANLINNAGKSNGSNTAKNLASQSLIGELAKGSGLGRLATSSLAGRIARPLDMVYKAFDVPEELRAKLAEVLLNPNSAESKAILARLSKAKGPSLESRISPLTGAIGQQAGVRVSQ